MNDDLARFMDSASDLEIAWYIVNLQASMINDQKVIIALQQQIQADTMNLVREHETQLDRLRRTLYPVN